MERVGRLCQVAFVLALSAGSSCTSPNTPSPPLASIVATPQVALQVSTPVSFRFTGSAGSTPSGADAALLYDFGDGTAAQSVIGTPGVDVESVTHRYRVAGTYRVTLTVTNPAGGSASAETTVTVRDLTGQWVLNGDEGQVDLVHSNSRLAGTLVIGTEERQVRGIAAVSTSADRSPAVSFGEPGGVAFSGIVDENFNQMTGRLTGGGIDLPNVTLTRH